MRYIDWINENIMIVEIWKATGSKQPWSAAIGSKRINAGCYFTLLHQIDALVGKGYTILRDGIEVPYHQRFLTLPKV